MLSVLRWQSVLSVLRVLRALRVLQVLSIRETAMGTIGTITRTGQAGMGGFESDVPLHAAGLSTIKQISGNSCSSHVVYTCAVPP